MVTVALNYEKFKIKQFLNKHKGKGINYPLEIDDWKTFEKNDATIVLNNLYIKEKVLCPTNISKNKTRIMKNDSKQRKGRMASFCSNKPSTLIRGIKSSKLDGNFYCLNCLHSFRTENKLEKVCKNNDLFGIVLPSEKDKILEVNQYVKTDKTTYTLFMLILNP